jgi:hypothetical protein
VAVREAELKAPLHPRDRPAGRKKNTFRMLALFEHNRGKYFKMISSGKKKSFFPFISLGEKKLVLVIYEFHGDHCYLLKPQ